MTRRKGWTNAGQDPMPHFGLALDDPDSHTRSARLQAVHAQTQRVEPFVLCGIHGGNVVA